MASISQRLSNPLVRYATLTIIKDTVHVIASITFLWSGASALYNMLFRGISQIIWNRLAVAIISYQVKETTAAPISPMFVLGNWSWR